MSIVEQKTVKNWLSRIAPKTGSNYLKSFRAFYTWLKDNSTEYADFTPDQLIEYQQEATNSERFKLLDLIQQFVNQTPGRIGYKKSIYSGLRSFFAHNRAEMPHDKTFSIRATKPRVIGTLTMDEVKNTVLSCNEVYRAVFLSMFQAGMGLEELIHWNLNGYEDLMHQLQEYEHGVPDDASIKISLPGRKRGRNITPYHTYLGKDSIEAIKNWLKKRPRGAKAIFTNNLGKPVTKSGIRGYWHRHLELMGYIDLKENDDTSNRYGKSVHELRDVFRSIWEKSPATYSVAEFVMGHVVDPLGYNKAFRDEDWTRGEYLKAVPYLNIISSGRAFGRVEEDEVERLRAHVQRLEAEKRSQDSELWQLMNEMRKEIEELKKLNSD